MAAVCLCLCALVQLACGAAGCSSNRSNFGDGRVVILFTNSHRARDEAFQGPSGSTGGLAARAAIVQQVRDEVGAANVLLFDTGDILGGTSTTLDRVSRGISTVLGMNALEVDAMVLGPHDLVYGWSNLLDLAGGPNVTDAFGNPVLPISPALQLEAFSQGAAFPVLASNLRDAASGWVPSGLQSGPVLFRLGAVRLGVFGITRPDSADEARLPSQLSFADAVATASSSVAYVAPDVDVVVCLSNQTDAQDAAMLGQVPGIEVLIGGGRAGFGGIFTRADALSGGQVPAGLPSGVDLPDGVFVRAEALGAAIGRLDLEVRDGVVVRADVTSIPLVGVAGDAAMAQLLEPFADQRDDALALAFPNAVVTANALLDGSASSVRSMETNWGDLVAAEVLAAAQLTDPEVDAALLNAGVFRGSATGTVTQGDVFDALPTGETVVLLEVTGDELVEALEDAVGEVPSEAFVQVAGLSFTWDAAEPSGSRVDPAGVTVAGSPLVGSATYTLAVNEWIAGGGDGFATLAGASGRVALQETIARIVLDALIAGPSTIAPATSGRIVRQN